jgi:hypothetical protein
MPSPVEEAQAAGYSDAEINAYLAPRMADALSAGYSQDEVNNYLGIKPPPKFDDDAVRQQINANLAAAPKPVTSFTDALQAGWQMGTTSLSIKPPTKTLAEDAPWSSRMAYNLAEMTGDVPAMAAGFAIGGGLGVETGPGAAITGAAGAFALPAALRGTLMDAYEKGQFTNFRDFWSRVAPIFIDTAKSWVTGAATGGAGKAAELAAPAIEAALPAAISPAVASATKTAAEIATMTTVGKGLEGQVPSAQDFIDAAIMLGGLKFAEMGAGKLRSIYARTGVPPSAVAADAAKDPTILQDLASNKPMPDAYADRMTATPGAGEATPESAATVAPPRVPFTPDFPDVVVQQPHGSPAHYLDHPDYAAAKAGDPEAAVRFVGDTIDPAKIDALRAAIGDSKPTVVAVHGEEAAGLNAIPERFAKVLSDALGLPVDTDIVQANRPGRTGQNAEYRMSVHSKFDGPVQPGHDYLIVDDNVTQGGTLADLRSYIESQGGHVVAASTLTGSRASEILAPRAETLRALRARFPALESRWQGTFGHDFNGLTEGEARYLLRSKGSDSRGDRIIARAQEGTAPEIRRDRRPGGEEGYGGEDSEDGGDDGGVEPPHGPLDGGSGPGGSSQAADAEHPATPGTASPPPGMSRSEYMQWVHQQNLDYIHRDRPYYQKVAAGWIDPVRQARGEHHLITVPEAEARLAELDRMEFQPTQYPPEAVDAFYGQYLERHGGAGASEGGDGQAGDGQGGRGTGPAGRDGSQAGGDAGGGGTGGNGGAGPPDTVAGLPASGRPPGPPAALDAAKSVILSHLSIGEAAPRRPWTFARLYTDVVNKLFPIEQAVTRTAGTDVLPAADDAGKLARLMSGATGIADRFLRYNTLDFATRQPNGPGLETILKPVADDMDGFRAYAAAQRALELESRDIRTGFDLDAARIVADQGADRYAKPLADLIDFQNRTATYLRDAGVLSRAGYDAMRGANKLYVPFQRVMEDEAGTGISGGASLQASNPVKGIKGSQREVVDPIESIIRNTYLFTQMAERNVVGTKLVDMLNAASETQPGHEAAPDPQAANALRAEGVANPEDLAPLMLSMAPVREGEIRILRDGAAETYKVDPELARAMKGLDAQSMGDIERMLRPFANALRAGAVLQPDFVLRHSIRDFLYATVTHPGLFSPMDLVRGFTSMAMKDADYQDWLSSGGAGVSMVSLDRRYLQQSIDQLTGTGILERAWNVIDNPNATLGQKAGAVAGVPLDAARKFLLNPMQMAVHFAESATHIGTFIKAKNEMLADQPEGATLTKAQTLEAGFASRDIAVDASRMGAKIRTLNALSAFSNIVIQDSDRVVRAFVKSPMATAIKVAGAISLPSALVWMNGKDDSRYEDAPDWERDLFWVIPTDRWEDASPKDYAARPDDPKLRRQAADGGYQVNNGITFRVPKPWGMGLVFGSGVERSLDSFAAHKPDAFKGLAASMGAVSLPSLIPNAITPIIEQYANRSMFTNRTLVPDQMEKFLPEYQYTPYTSETAKALGQIIGAFPGVEQAKTEQGAAGGVARALSSPILMENYLRAWTGNLGTYALQLADAGLRKAGVVPDPPNLPASTLADIPFVRAFIVRSPSSSAQSIQDFQDDYERNKIYYDTWMGMAKEGNGGAMQRVQQAGGPAIFATLDGMHTALAMQSKLVRDVYRNPDMPPDEKRQLIDTAYWRMSEIAKNGVTAQRQIRAALSPQ